MVLGNKRITTERLTLDAIRESDFESLMTILKNETVSKTYMVPNLRSEEDEKKLFSIILKSSQRADRYVYGIFLSGQLIGIINDTEIKGKRIELGYAIDPEYFSKGYMTEALSGLIKHLFLHEFKEVICGAFENNCASIRVMEKCGMRKMRKTEEITYRNEIHKCIFYSVKKHAI